MSKALQHSTKFVSLSTGEAFFKGENLLTVSGSRLREIRGGEIAMIFQDPMTSLNPVHSIGTQLIEATLLHQDVSKKQARKLAIEALKDVGIPRAERRIDDYPHQFSGGMRQRVMIAMALINDPKLLIADEPTTALDVTTQAQILELMNRMQEEHGTAIVMITHDLGVVAEVADEVVVMYAGPRGRAGTGRQHLRAADAPVHVGPARLAAAARDGCRAPDADPRPASVVASASCRLPVQSALHLCLRSLPSRAPGARPDALGSVAYPGVLPRRGDEAARSPSGAGRVRS